MRQSNSSHERFSPKFTFYWAREKVWNISVLFRLRPSYALSVFIQSQMPWSLEIRNLINRFPDDLLPASRDACTEERSKYTSSFRRRFLWICTRVQKSHLHRFFRLNSLRRSFQFQHAGLIRLAGRRGSNRTCNLGRFCLCFLQQRLRIQVTFGPK